MNPLAAWLDQRRLLSEELIALLHESFAAAAALDAVGFRNLIERQEELCQRIRAWDRQQPPPSPYPEANLNAALALRAMNSRLRQLSDVLAILARRGSDSALCMQRVWAVGAAAYQRPVTPA